MLYNRLKRLIRNHKGDSGDNYVSIPEGAFYDILRMALANVQVDEAFYFKEYPDIKKAVQGGQIASAQAHFANMGYFEDRLPFFVIVDENYYLEQNPDVKQAKDKKRVQSAQSHFDQNGRFKGRLPSENFSLFKKIKPPVI